MQDFESVFHEYFREVHRFIARRVGSDAADDIAAEVFSRAFRNWARFDRARGRERPWLYGIAANVMRDHRRREVRALRAHARAYALAPSDRGTEDGNLEEIVAGDVTACCLTAIAALRLEEREVVLLNAWADLTYSEISEALGIPVGTVRSRLSRARQVLRVTLNSAMDEVVRPSRGG
jgi:RNA polymerase sigma-70 factor (ECF subfamily)